MARPGALRHLGAVELGDDLVDGARLRRDRRGDVGIAERAIALAVARQIERDDRDALAPRVGPDIGLGPMQDRMNAQMGARRRRGVEVIPEFRRLIADIPAALDPARREHPFLGAGRLLVAANAGEQAVESVFGQGELQSFGLACRRAGGRRQRRINRLDRRTGLDQEIEIPLDRVAIPEGVHLRKLLAGIHVQRRKRHPPEKRLAGEPDHDVGIFAERPQQGETLETGEALPKDEDALGFELAETIHRAVHRTIHGAHSGALAGWRPRNLRPKNLRPKNLCPKKRSERGIGKRTISISVDLQLHCFKRFRFHSSIFFYFRPLHSLYTENNSSQRAASGLCISFRWWMQSAPAVAPMRMDSHA